MGYNSYGGTSQHANFTMYWSKNKTKELPVVNSYGTVNTPYQAPSHLNYRSVFLNLTDCQKYPGLSLTGQTPELCWGCWLNRAGWRSRNKSLGDSWDWESLRNCSRSVFWTLVRKPSKFRSGVHKLALLARTPGESISSGPWTHLDKCLL